MSFRIRENLGGLVAATSKIPSVPKAKPQIGKVYGIVLDETTPSKELFDKSGGWSGIGTIFYLDYDQSKNIPSTNVDLNTCKIAKPFHASNQNYPLIGELVHLMDAPSPSSQVNNTSNQKYYLGTINVWNNNQQNSLTDDSLGKTFTEKNDIRNLRSFSGDRIYQGRKGNGIRFGSTVKQRSNINEWSSVGEDGDPITILVNGYVTTDSGSLTPNIEEINKEKSSIYLTTTQKLPLQPGASIVNPRVNTVKPSDYISSQFIANSDRITLNAKKDEVLLFAKGNIELNSDNIININAGIAHINSPSIALGTKSDGSYPTEPVLLGGKTYELFLEICSTLTNLAGFLASATVATKEGAICVTDCNLAGEQLFNDINNLLNKLETITSTKVYTV
jgi:hypothetical protein